jgi:hypothetical protein
MIAEQPEDWTSKYVCDVMQSQRYGSIKESIKKGGTVMDKRRVLFFNAARARKSKSPGKKSSKKREGRQKKTRPVLTYWK